MSIIQIYSILFIILGLVETLANLFYLITPKGIHLAYKQHRELPKAVSHKRMKIKMITMLLIGIMLLLAGIYGLLLPQSAYICMLAALIGFTVYMVAETLYYRQPAGIAFSALSVVLLIVFYMF